MHAEAVRLALAGRLMAAAAVERADREPDDFLPALLGFYLDFQELPLGSWNPSRLSRICATERQPHIRHPWEQKWPAAQTGPSCSKARKLGGTPA